MSDMVNHLERVTTGYVTLARSPQFKLCHLHGLTVAVATCSAQSLGDLRISIFFFFGQVITLCSH